MKKDILNPLLEGLGGQRRIKYTLDRLKMALAKLGNPQRSVNSLVIAGTNGKGSTALYVSSSLAEAGFKVGTFLSPHLYSPTERFLKNLNPIEYDTLTGLALEAEPIAKESELTYFEFLALIFYLWSKREKMDMMVLEVGLGGRLDATNVTSPIASVVTTIALDHQAYLGDRVEQILDEKLGILRPEGLLFTGVQDSGLRKQIEKHCLELDAIAYYSDGIRKKVLSRNWESQKVELNDYPFQLNNPSLGTLDNAALAFLVLRILFPKIPVSCHQKGFESVHIPGRLELVSDHPRVVLSGDHNPAGLKCTLDTLKSLSTGRLYVLCGFSPDKPFQKMVEMLSKVAQEIRVSPVKEFSHLLPEGYQELPGFIWEPKAAIEDLISRMEPSDTLLITGSLYLVGEVRPLWRSKVEFFQNHHTTRKQSSSRVDDANPAKVPASAKEQTLSPQI